MNAAPETLAADSQQEEKPPSSMRINYVLIDSENVRPEVLGRLSHECFHVIIFVGANRPKLDADAVFALQDLRELGGEGKYIRMSGNGPNALDFHIAYYMGKLAASNREAFYHIISKDTGFDPLINFLKKKEKILAARWAAVAEIPLVKALEAKSPAQRVALVAERLTEAGATKPRTVQGLDKKIASIFSFKHLAKEEIEAIRKGLIKEKVIEVDGSKVDYSITSVAPVAEADKKKPVTTLKVNSSVPEVSVNGSQENFGVN